MQFCEKPTNGPLAKDIRKSARVRRPRLDGHRLLYSDVKVLLADVTETRAVIRHVTTDPDWQLWTRDEDGWWDIVGVYPTEEEARHGAERGDSRPLPPPLHPGSYVFAAWPGKHPTMRVRASTPYTAKEVAEVFERIGAVPSFEEVA